MPTMTKTEIIEEMVSEGYDYDTAYRLVCGTSNSDDIIDREPDYEKAFNEFDGKISDYCDDADSDLDLFARADEAEAYNERYEFVIQQKYNALSRSGK